MRSLLLPLVVAGSLAVALPAYGQDDPRKVQAAPYFEDGRKLADKGQNAESLEKFKKALSIYPSPNTLFNVARQEQLLGRRLEALRDYREALRNPVLLPSVAEAARTYVADLERVLGRVKIVGPDGARMSVGGAEYTLPHADPIDVEPGSIHIIGTLGSETLTATAQALAGTLITVDLGGKTAPPVEPPVETPAATASFWGLRSIAGLVLVGAGAVAIGASVAASSEQSTQQDKLDGLASSLPAGDPGSRCFNSLAPACGEYRDARSARDDAEARGGRWLAVGVSAAVVGAGLVASALIWPHARGTAAAASRPRVLPITARGGAGLIFISDF